MSAMQCMSSNKPYLPQLILMFILIVAPFATSTSTDDIKTDDVTKSPTAAAAQASACGPNAEFISLADDTSSVPHVCKCKPGYDGDPHNTSQGCRKSSKLKLMCEYQNKSYGIEETFFDGCDKKCVCSEALEVDCTPRCPEVGSADPLCSLVEDAKDPCCKVLACESRVIGTRHPPAIAAADTAAPPSLPQPDLPGNNMSIDVGNGSANTISVNQPIRADGCRSESNPGVYRRRGEVFHIGCESKCVCSHSGSIQCEPRCSLFQGFDKNVCQLMPDPMDAECCKIAVCDLTGFETDRIRDATTGKAEVRSLILDSVEAYNATAARIRVYLTPSNETRSRKVLFQAFFAKIDSPASFDESEKIVAKWNSVKLDQERNNLKGPHVVTALRHAYDFEIDALEPSTEYFIKIHELNANLTSNTVVVRTFPPGIDASFSGCFHGNKTYEAGQVFFDGCAYKCTCREGGLRECEERCPVFIDTIGYENCEWQAAPDDPCCTIPVCSNQTAGPSQPAGLPRVMPAAHDSIPQPTMESVEPFCISSSNDVYTVGQSWSEGTSCLPKSCKCLPHPNGSTVTECKGGCAAIPDPAFRPTIECPKPELITPEDACLCPYVVCNHPRNTIIPPPRLPNSSLNTGLHQRPPLPPIQVAEHPHSSPRPAASQPAPASKDPKGCPFKGKVVPFGEEVYDGCRAVCHCGADGQMNCGLIDCPHHFGSRVSECAEWEIDPEFELAPPNCCPKMKCKPSGSCIFAGLPVENFKAIPSDLLPCGTKCVCLNGNITCENRCPPLSDIPPLSLPCPDHMKFKGHAKGETCCLQWMCRDHEKAGSCVHNGIRRRVNEEWDDTPPASPNGLAIVTQKRCQCKLLTDNTSDSVHSSTKTTVECGPAQCPQITERHLRPSPECPVPVVVTPEDPTIMCPYVVCNHSEETGKSLEHVSVIAMNSTSVRIRFTLPQILVGLIGHAELHFTSNPLVPSYEWNVQKFARPNRLFDTPNIEYHLMNLKPETTYYFQIRVIVEALQSGPESEIYKLKMPATGSKNGMNAASGVTSTTTSTLPPLVMIDVHLNAVVDDSDGPGSGTSVTVTWRPLDRRERKLIDGIQIKYRKIDEPESAASVTPIIHRDLTSYKLKNLDPGSSYLLDLLFKTEEDIASNVVSSKPIVIELPAAGRGDQQPAAHSPVSLLIDPLTDVFVEAHKASFRLRSLPKPIDKFVAVVKISYRNTDGDQEQAPAGLMHMFRAPDEQVALDGLKPRRKYKVWIDCYLISGKMLSSNAIDVMTKEEDGAKSGDGAINHSQDESQDAMNEALASESTKSTSTGTHQHSLKSDELRPYYIALTIMALFAAVTSIAFLSLLCVILRSKSSAKAPITRSLSDQAYDNPTYKACDNERTGSNAANDHNHHHNNLNHRNHDPHHLPQQIKLNGMNGATIIGTAQV